MIQRPISSPVNGDDPEAVVRTGSVAFALPVSRSKKVRRHRDMICYRNRGHNDTYNASFHPSQLIHTCGGSAGARRCTTES